MELQSSSKPLRSTSHFSSNLLFPLLPPSNDASEAKDPVSPEEEPTGVDQCLSEILPSFCGGARGPCFALDSEARPSWGRFQVSFLRNGVLFMLPEPAISNLYSLFLIYRVYYIF